MIGIINLETSNITSLTNSLDYLKIKYKIVKNKNELKTVNKIILPGVGSFENGVKSLQKLSLFEELIKEVKENKKPILGICLGMQLLFESSEESKGIVGLSLLKGKVLSLISSSSYKIPRIGWAESEIKYNFLGLQANKTIDFYYIHSYHVIPADQNIICIVTDNNLTSAIKYKNIYACQFHPEKSHIYGLNILNTFARENG